MNTIKQIVDNVQSNELKTIAIAGISLEELEIVEQATAKNLAEFILIDTEKTISNMILKYGKNISAKHIYVNDLHNAPTEAVKLVKEKIADMPMKGQIHTGTFLKAVLHKENGLANSSASRISQITAFDGYNGEIQFLTDCAININPNTDELIAIIKNAVSLYQKLGEEIPKVALLGAVETVGEKMPDTIVSAVITQMNRRNQITDCIIDGPLSLDNAVSKKYAEIKNIVSPVAGRAQILVASSINEANSLSKGIIHYAKIPAASLIAGTISPIIMTSRTDTIENKLNTIAFTSFLKD